MNPPEIYFCTHQSYKRILGCSYGMDYNLHMLCSHLDVVKILFPQIDVLGFYLKLCGYLLSNIILFSQGIEKIAWDNSGERLAVSFKGGDDVYGGLIAVYDTRRTPLISTSLM
jgi:hypothetical protein